MKAKITTLLFTLLLLSACVRTDTTVNPPLVAHNAQDNRSEEQARETLRETFIEVFWHNVFLDAGLPSYIADNIKKAALEGPEFLIDLIVILQQDPYTYILVDKEHSLPITYEPDDLVPLRAGSFRISRNDLALRRMAVDALEEMAEAALRDGISLVVGSTYRSGLYQEEVYERWVRQLGRQEADRISARPGHSQHQLGLVVDFVPIDPSFAATPAAAWLKENAAAYGWSLSYPEGYEHITGYSYESWHYRYVGKELAEFIDMYFDGIQQYALLFIQAWQNN